MRLCSYYPIFLLLSLFTVTSALPVDVQGLNPAGEFQVRDIEPGFTLRELSPLEKRDNAALTYLFTTLNTTGTGVAAVKAAIEVSLTQQQIIKFIANLITTKNLTSLLEAADESNLGLDLVLLFLEHYEVWPGVIAIVEDYKGESSNSTTSSSSSSSSSSGGIISSLLSGVTSVVSSIFGLGSSSTSSTSSTSTSTASATATSSTATSTSTSSSSGGLLSGILGLFGLDSSSSSTTTTAATTATSTTATAVAGTATTAATTTATTAAATTGTATTTGTTTKTSSTAAATTTTSVAGSILSGVTSIISSIFKRDDLSSEELEELLKRSDINIAALLTEINARFEDEGLDQVEKRDIVDTVYSEVIALIGSNANIELVCESLDKSGLGVNVVYNAIVDSDWYDFDVNLVKYLVDNKIITLSSLFTALLDSGIVLSIAGDIIGSTTYLKLVLNFVIACFDGTIDIWGLISLFF